MNIKRIWLVIPITILPYVILASLVVIYFSSWIFGPIESLFPDDQQYLVGPRLMFSFIGLVFLFAAIAVALAVVCFVISIKRNWDAVSLAKTAMIIKLIQIPAYVVFFCLVPIFLVTVWLFVVGFLLIGFACVIFLMTGLLNTAAVIVAIRKNTIEWKDYYWAAIFQCVFCADIMASIIFYVYLKRTERAVEKITAHTDNLEL